MKLIATEEHKSNYPNPICFKSGDCLILEKKETEFEGWVWVTTNDGNQGWAPIQYIQLKKESSMAVAKRDYTAKELDIYVGDVLLLHHKLNDWGWVEKKDGSCGWVPMKTTKIV